MIKQKYFLIDMDGVLITGNKMIPGADHFIERLTASNREYLILTNNPSYTPRDLAHRLQMIGLNIPPERIFTSAIATARFLRSQRPNGKAYVIGESGLSQALHDVGYISTDMNPDYVVLGEVQTLTLDQVTQAIRFISNGALFIATNPDPNGPKEEGLVAACGAIAALIEKASGRSPFFVGKPNPLMFRTAMRFMGSHSDDTVMVGDRMDTDILAGVMSGLDTILVLTGVTNMDKVKEFPYQPTHIVQSVAHIELD